MLFSFSCYQYVASRCVLDNFDLNWILGEMQPEPLCSGTSGKTIENIFTFIS